MEELPRKRSERDRAQPARAADDLRIINEFALSLLAQASLDDLLWEIAEKIGAVLGFEDCVVYLLEGETLIQRAAFGIKSPKPREIANPIEIPLGDGVVGEVAQSGVGRIVEDTRKIGSYIPDQVQGLSELAVPIRFGGRVIGVIDSECVCVGGYTKSDLEMVEWIANIAASRIASAWSEVELRAAQEDLRLANESLEERVRLATEELAGALKQVHRAQLLESVGQLAAGVAHDLNNILTTIQGNIGLAQMDAPSAGPLHDALAIAADSCHRAQELSSRLLALADGGAPKREESSGIADLVQEVASSVLGDAGIRIDFKVDNVLPSVKYDSVQIRHAVRNLFENSRQAMPDGGGVKITGRSVAGDGGSRWVEFEISDSGPGIVDEHRSRIFDPYFTTMEGHVGLGLTIAQSILARHGGALDLLPAEADGASFKLRIPACQSKAKGDEHERQELHGASVLVMDDEGGIRILLERILPRLGYSVVVTANGDEAILQFHRRVSEGRPFDVVILDLTVPGGMGGLKTLEVLRRSDPEIPAIVMSGYSSDGAIAESKRHGFNAALSKPFTAEDLREVLREAIGSARGS